MTQVTLRLDYDGLHRDDVVAFLKTQPMIIFQGTNPGNPHDRWFYFVGRPISFQVTNAVIFVTLPQVTDVTLNASLVNNQEAFSLWVVKTLKVLTPVPAGLVVSRKHEA